MSTNTKRGHPESTEESGALKRDELKATDPLTVPQWLTRVTPQHYYNAGGLSGVGHEAHEAGPASSPSTLSKDKAFHIAKFGVEFGAAGGGGGLNSPGAKRAGNSVGISFDLTAPSPANEFDAAPFFQARTTMMTSYRVDADGNISIDLPDVEGGDDVTRKNEASEDPSTVTSHQQTSSDAAAAASSRTNPPQTTEFISFKDKIYSAVPFGENFPMATEQSLDSLTKLNQSRTTGSATTTTAAEEELFSMDDEKTATNLGSSANSVPLPPRDTPTTSLTKAVLDKGLPDNWFFRGPKDASGLPEHQGQDASGEGIDKKIKEMREFNIHMPINL